MTFLRRLTPNDMPRFREFWKQHWSGEEMVVHGETFRPEQLDGFIADDWIGFISFYIKERQCEIVSLDSLEENRGIGSTLIEEVVNEARKRNCRRVFLSTTNDNLRALGFYQKRGFQISEIRCGAVEGSRKIKPGIPLIGMNEIPLRDEIELELILNL